MKYTNLVVFVGVVFSLSAMEEQVRKKLGSEVCQHVLAAWNLYEKRLLVTMLALKTWPALPKGEPIRFAQDKQVFKDRFYFKCGNKLQEISMADFKMVAQLDQVPVFTNYNAEVVKFDDFRQHFETEDEVWQQLDRQLTRST